MWFKNLRVFRFTKPFSITPEELNSQLEERHFQPCGSQDQSRYGWVPPLGRHGSEYVHVTNGYIMLCARKQDKILPSQVIKEAMEEKILSIEEQEGRPLGRKERQTLKDEVIIDLLPKAFTRSVDNFAYIAPREQWLVVNAASASKAEELLNYLRETIGSLPVIPITAKNLPQDKMTDWLKQGYLPENFELGHECELRNSLEASSVIRCKHQDLAAEEINNHMQSGMLAAKLGIRWQDRIECLIDDQLAIKRLKFEDIIQEQAREVEAEDVADQFDVDFSIMSLELSAFIQALIVALGGEDLSAIAEDTVASGKPKEEIGEKAVAANVTTLDYQDSEALEATAS